MIKNFLSEDGPASEPEAHEATAKASTPAPASASGSTLGLFDSPVGDSVPTPQADSQFTPESSAETFRQSGLAYSAGIAFSAAVIFMLVLGWGADVLLGTSPWGIVGGIILGSVIGFIQFFRLTSQIFKK